MAGSKCSGSLVLIVMLLLVSITGKASAAPTPNSWWSCMQDCPKYNCSAWMPQVACTAYCGTLCAIPPTNTLAAAADSVDRFCKLGCISSKCSTLSSNVAGADAVNSCIRGCSDVCTSPTKAGKPVVV